MPDKLNEIWVYGDVDKTTFLSLVKSVQEKMPQYKIEIYDESLTICLDSQKPNFEILQSITKNFPVEMQIYFEGMMWYCKKGKVF